MLKVFEEIGESSRRQILSELRLGPRNVSDLVRATGLKQPNVSNHLARLRAKGIVHGRKVGREVFYGLANPEVEAVVKAAFASPDPDPLPLDIGAMARRYVEAAVHGDEAGCGELLDELYRARVPLLDIYQDFLGPAMEEVGRRFEHGEIDVAHEHMATEITERMMARTIQISGVTRRSGRCALLGCAEGTRHVIGVRMISDYLRCVGWRTLFLGADVPVPAFLNAVRQYRPQLVMVSCGSEEHLDAALELVRRLAEPRRKPRRYRLVVGGKAADSRPDLFTQAGADWYAPDLRAFARQVLPAVDRSLKA